MNSASPKSLKMFSQTRDPRALRLLKAVDLWAIDPSLGGIWLRARPSPVRDAVLALVRCIDDAAWHKINPTVSDEALFGGLDIGATLSAGRPVLTQGILGADAPQLMLTQSESAPAHLTARIGTSLDRGARLLAIDEGGEDEGLHENLRDRLAFHFDLDGMRYDALDDLEFNQDLWRSARDRLASIAVEPVVETLAVLAARLQISSLRAVGFAVKAARACAALAGHTMIDDDDLNTAAMMVFSPRTIITDFDETEQEDETPNEDQQSHTGMLEDRVLDAVRANLPSAALLAFLSQQKAARQMQGSGAGSRKKGNRRGRPIAPRPGALGGGNRLDILATLRRAVPYQNLRHRDGPIALRKEDFVIKRFQTESDRLIVFSVDASGSSAAKRLGEAKGAVETLLSEAYARRDHVALIAFRKEGAEVLLPPTRSLVQAKRHLGALPGGGGTPLAAGLQAGFYMALAARKKGMSPAMVLLSDGGANIALDGTPGRPQAQADAETVARHFATQNMPCLTIDTGRRPDATLQKVSSVLGGAYFALPPAQSAALGETLKSTLLN